MATANPAAVAIKDDARADVSGAALSDTGVTADARVTGIDISSESLNYARMLAERMGIEAPFVESDVMDVMELVDAPPLSEATRVPNE